MKRKFLTKLEYVTETQPCWEESDLVQCKEWRLFAEDPFGPSFTGIRLLRLTFTMSGRIIWFPEYK